jgi:prepilin-type N-terminal cleavage/methylation domain-containing protein
MKLSYFRGRKSAVKKGFTLIELLTVIAIIGILAAILIPVTAGVRERARRSVCQSNIRGQLIAMFMFAEDHYGQPLSPNAPAGSTPGYWNVIAASNDNAPIDLYPEYSDDESLFICPSTKNIIRLNVRDRRGFLTDLFTNAQNREDNRGGHSYEYFGVYGTAGSMERTDLVGVIKTPGSALDIESRTALVVDGDDTPGMNNCPDPTNNHAEDGWNWGFASGHVEWVPRERSNEVSWNSFHSRTRCP